MTKQLTGKGKLIAKLTELGVEFDPKATIKVLKTLLPKEPVEPKTPLTPEGESTSVPTVPAAVVKDRGWETIANQYVFIKEPQTRKALNTANFFAAQERVSYTIFPTPQNPEEKLYWGGINGFFFSVVVGVTVELPKGIVEHITKSRLANARLAPKIVIADPFTGKLVEVNLDAATDETKARLGIL